MKKLNDWFYIPVPRLLQRSHRVKTWKSFPFFSPASFHQRLRPQTLSNNGELLFLIIYKAG